MCCWSAPCLVGRCVAGHCHDAHGCCTWFCFAGVGGVDDGDGDGGVGDGDDDAGAGAGGVLGWACRWIVSEASIKGGRADGKWKVQNNTLFMTVSASARDASLHTRTCPPPLWDQTIHFHVAYLAFSPLFPSFHGPYP